MPKIKLSRIHCKLPDEIDKDEMYLKMNGEKIWPAGSIYYRVDTGDIVDLDVTLDVKEGWTEIELWDFDYLSRNDFLGKFRFKVDSKIGKYTNTMTLVEENSSASYLLEWEIVHDPLAKAAKKGVFAVDE